jgi:DNA-binding response OmpR family regulator/predicted regulator of Ras-like GTPase activity (Roadblock/LC7/MglB family)
MSKQWRIFVVEDDKNLNRNIVNALRENYIVKSTMSIAGAASILRLEEYDVVVCDLKTTGADGFELLQWIRAYRPQVRTIMVGESSTHMQALEKGAVGYLEQPLNIQRLQEELRRLLQHTGFSANLESFDLLDVIQIINISRKSIVLVVNTGLEQQGVLHFQNGELIWAEYGILKGEEAFFALAAYKNGTVIQQEWTEQVTPNVRQSLSRLILQALQYREKYADMQQASGKQDAVLTTPSLQQSNQSPFALMAEAITDPPTQVRSSTMNTEEVEELAGLHEGSKEWWQLTGKVAVARNKMAAFKVKISTVPLPTPLNHGNNGVHQTAITSRTDLPSWLTDQPTMVEIPAVGPSTDANLLWRSTEPPISPEWQPTEVDDIVSLSGPLLESLVTAHKTSGPLSNETAADAASDSFNEQQALIKSKYNYTSLVSALQTLGYTINGFLAAAVVSLDGRTMAHVAVDNLDISGMSIHFSYILQSILQLDEGAWGGYEHTVITHADRHILLRLVGSEKNAFQVLITTRDADPQHSLEIMANAESAISAALY